MSNMQHCADKGNGFYENPIIFGDMGDSSILKDGKDYFLVYGGGGAKGSMLYHSRDLVNWEVMYPLFENLGLGLWAPEICKVGDTYYYYNFYPLEEPHWNYGNVIVSYTKDIWAGNWSEPQLVRANIPSIDPGHVIGEDGKRYIFMSQNMVFPLTDDGLKAAGDYKIVYPSWPIPDEYDIEGQCTESPKLTWHDGWLYLTTAQGGTFGPATAHMVTSLRSRSIYGPWELSPYNPIRHTDSKKNKWARMGHGSLVEGPDGKQWYLVYQAFLGDHRVTTGKATMLQPIEWTEDGWWRVDPKYTEDDLIPMPEGGEKVEGRYCLSTDFSEGKLGALWLPSALHTEERISFSERGLTLVGKGENIATSSPIYQKREHVDLEVIAELTADWHAAAGICIGNYGIAVEQDRVEVFNGDNRWMLVREHWKKNEKADWSGNHIFLKLICKDDVVSPWYSYDGEDWKKINICYDSSLSNGFGLYPGIFCAKYGQATFHKFIYNGLDKE